MTTQSKLRDSHPYHMYEAMVEQPAAIRRVLNEEKDAVEGLAETLSAADRIHVVGIGTSWHASLVGEHLFRTAAGRQDARAWNSFEFCQYPPDLSPGDAVLVMTHTGIKTYSAAALETAKSHGAQTAVFTSTESEVNPELADQSVRTSRRERSAAYTISHTAAMTALAMTAIAVGTRTGVPGATELSQELDGLPDLVESALGQEATTRGLAKQSVDARHMYFTGWGPNRATAYEVALKIKETSYLTPEGFEVEQYLHGPFVATHSGGLVTSIAPPGPGLERANSILRAAKHVGADTAALVESGDPVDGSAVDTVIELPRTSEPLTPIVYLVPLQLLTYHLALEVGRNPDTFRRDDPVHFGVRDILQL